MVPLGLLDSEREGLEVAGRYGDGDPGFSEPQLPIPLDSANPSNIHH